MAEEGPFTNKALFPIALPLEIELRPEERFSGRQMARDPDGHPCGRDAIRLAVAGLRGDDSVHDPLGDLLEQGGWPELAELARAGEMMLLWAALMFLGSRPWFDPARMCLVFRQAPGRRAEDRWDFYMPDRRWLDYQHYGRRSWSEKTAKLWGVRDVIVAAMVRTTLEACI